LKETGARAIYATMAEWPPLPEIEQASLSDVEAAN
jgi:hypothetical protein